MKIYRIFPAVLTIASGVLLALPFAGAGKRLNERRYVTEHCREWDPVSEPQQLEGRRLWARKCNYITDRILEALRQENLYPSFYNQRPPVEQSAPCGHYSELSLVQCKVSCFSSEAKLWFEMIPLDLDKFFNSRVTPQTVTTMSEQATLDKLLVSELPFDAILKSRYRGILVQITLENLSDPLQITDDHFMVDSGGNMIEAHNLFAGQSLLSTSGPRKITSVQSVNFDGELWNVTPHSNLAKGNVIVANGLFTGGLGYFSSQSKSYRIALRTELAKQFLNASQL